MSDSIASGTPTIITAQTTIILTPHLPSTPSKKISNQVPYTPFTPPLNSNNSTLSSPTLITTTASTSKATPASTKKSKLSQIDSFHKTTPFPNFLRPSVQECQNVHDLLSSVHGQPVRPAVLVDKPGGKAGCGETPDVLDALVRTILSQNTTSKNSTAAKNAMDLEYGRANYAAVLTKPVETLIETIRSGGLAKVKGNAIYGILKVCQERLKVEGKERQPLSLDYLHDLEDLDAMKELVGFPGVGPKTASCVLLFCLGRESFAVDTHVFRICTSLGWLPTNANRNTAFAHLDLRIPPQLKYGIHSLLVTHGRSCIKCSANGVTSMNIVNTCPINEIVKRSKDSNGGKSKGKKVTGVKGKKVIGIKGKGKGKKVESDEEEEEEEEAVETDAGEEDDDEENIKFESNDKEEEFEEDIKTGIKSSPSHVDRMVSGPFSPSTKRSIKVEDNFSTPPVSSANKRQRLATRSTKKEVGLNTEMEMETRSGVVHNMHGL